MRSRRSLGGKIGIVFLFIASLSLAGCFDGPQEVSLPPKTTPQSQDEVGLGPGVRPLSYGPGVKGSPSWNPSGSRIAFTVDGYVVGKAPGDRSVERLTTKDFRAKTVAWTSSGDSLAIMGVQSSPGAMSFYETSPAENSLEVDRISSRVQEMAPGPGNEWVLLGLDRENAESGLALVEPGGDIQNFPVVVGGEITGMSVTPAGDQAILAVENTGTGQYEIYTFSFLANSLQQVTRLEEGLEIVGDPQWTEKGVYYIAGEEENSLEQDAALFDLYRVPEGSSTPERAPGVGDDFVASNLKRDPKGQRLALVGRRNPGSSENLYILDLNSKNLEATTSNEDMQIKTNPEDLAWAPDGNSVVIVARAVLSEPKVYSAPADTLVTDFYNLYEVSVGEPVGGDEV